MKKLIRKSVARLIASCAALLLCVSSNAQTFECFEAPTSSSPIPHGITGGISLPCSPSSSIYTSFFRHKESYIPVNGDLSALYVHKTIKIAIHVIQPTYPAAYNYTSSDEYMIDDFIDQANDYLENNHAPTDPIYVGGRNPWVWDTRFRIEVKSIDYTATNLTFDDVNVGSSGSVTPFDLLDGAGLFTDKDNVLNVFLMYSTVNSTPGGFQSSTGTSPFVVLKNYYKNTGFRSSPEKCADILLHEIGHAFELYHTYYLDYGVAACCPETITETDLDYLEDVFGSTATTKYTYRPYNSGSYSSPPFGTIGDDYTNNAMGGHYEGHYFSPQQIGRMHRNAYLRYVRNVVYNTYPEDDNHDNTGQGQFATLDITSNQTWDFDIKMYNDIVVKSGSTLTIACRVMMPHMSNIIVEKGAKLIVDGGIITSDRKDDFWYGISVLGDKSLTQDIASNQGIVETKNGAILSNALHAITAGDDVFKDYSKCGGIIRAVNTHFYNNKNSVAFWSYENKAVWPVGYHLPNRSYIRDCLFELDDSYNYDNTGTPSRRPNQQVSAWDVDGVVIEGCTFDNKMTSTKRTRINTTGGDGIVSFEGAFTVKDYCPTLVLGIPCSPTGYTPSTIKGFANGVRAEAVVSKPFTVSRTKLSFNGNGVNMAGITGALVRDNNFDVVRDPTTTAANTLGVQAYGSNAYKIYNNKFEPNTLLSYLNNIGVRIIEGGSDQNDVRNNIYNGMLLGNISQGLNTNGPHILEASNSGLQFLCNTYDNVTNPNYRGIDQYIYGSDVLLDGIRSNQGTSSNPAENAFTDPTDISYHVRLFNALPIDVYYTGTASLHAPTKYTSGAIGTVTTGASSPNCSMSTGGSGFPSVLIGSVSSTATFEDLALAFMDTAQSPGTEIVTTYQNMASAYADAELSLYYISHGNIAGGQTLYSSILSGNPYGLNSKELYEFQIGQSLVNLLADHYTNAITMDSLSNDDVDTLHFITGSSQMWPRAKACAWLHFALEEECDKIPFEVPEEEEGGEEGRNMQRTASLDPTSSSLMIKPNPSTDYFTIAYGLDKDAQLVVSDISGRIIAKVELSHEKNSYTIDARQWQTGVYLYKVSQGDKTMYYGKMLKH